MPRTTLFEMGTTSDRGVITLTVEGLDVIRAIVMRWIMQAERGETAARELARAGGDTYSANQAAYFRAAASFLLARLTSHLVQRINIREQLAIIARWKDGEDLPPGWTAFLGHALTTGDDGGTLDTATRGGGDGGHGDDGRPPMDGGLGGPVDPPAPPSAAPRHDPAESGVKTRPGASRPRKGRAGSDH